MKMTLKNQLLLATTICTLLVALTFWMAQRISASHQMEQKTQTNVAYTQALWSAVSGSHFDKMESEATGLIRNRDAVSALKDGDTAALQEPASLTFDRMEAGGAVDGMLITDSFGKIVFSAGRPAPATLAQIVANEKKVRHELLHDSAGQPTLAVAFPLYYRGKVKGVGIYLSGLEPVIAQIAGNAGSIVSVLDGKGQLLHSSEPQTAQGIDWASLPHGQPAWRMVSAAGASYATTLIPLIGLDGQTFAQLTLQRDFTEVAASVRRIELLQNIAVLAVILLAIGIVYRQISAAFRPLHKAAEAMAAISQGDLSTEVSCDSKNEIADMLAGIQRMRDYLRDIIGAIHTATGELNQVVIEAGAVAERSVSGAMRQKEGTDSVATAMTEMSSTVHAVADNALAAADAARHADGEAKQGQQVVEATVHAIRSLADEVRSGAEAIERVRQESDAIGQILDVIRGIAEQTNLLALNAAIEAARAGEQGRGFAVVADEVRTLASRTQASTTEIQAMIERLQQGTQQAVGVMESSRQRAEGSESQVHQAGSALEAITAAVSRISEMNTQIAGAAEEQGRVAEEINRNVINISAVAEETVVGAGQSTAANQRISGLAGQLQELVGRFRL